MSDKIIFGRPTGFTAIGKILHTYSKPFGSRSVPMRQSHIELVSFPERPNMMMMHHACYLKHPITPEEKNIHLTSMPLRIVQLYWFHETCTNIAAWEELYATLTEEDKHLLRSCICTLGAITLYEATARVGQCISLTEFEPSDNIANGDIIRLEGLFLGTAKRHAEPSEIKEPWWHVSRISLASGTECSV